MTRSAQESDGAERRESAVNALIARKQPGRSIRRIEREAGLTEGTLAHHLKSHRRGRMPHPRTMQRFADAIGAHVTEVAKAFAIDSNLAADTSALLTNDEQELMDLYRRLPDQQQGLFRAQLDAHVAYVKQ